MLHLLDNPGVFHQASASLGMLPMKASAWVVAIFGVFALLGVYYKPFRRPWLVLVLLASLVVSVIVSLSYVSHEESQIKSQQAKYDSSVVSWLDTGYGIKTNTEIAQRLIDGETFAVTYHGQEIVVAVTEKINGDLAVVDQNHTVLQQKN